MSFFISRFNAERDFMLIENFASKEVAIKEGTDQIMKKRSKWGTNEEQDWMELTWGYVPTDGTDVTIALFFTADTYILSWLYKFIPFVTNWTELHFWGEFDVFCTSSTNYI